MRPQEHYTDEELVRLLLTTQDEALRADSWEEFWRRFQPVIARVIRRRILRRCGRAERDLVDDLVQETFKKICADKFKVLRNFEFRHADALPRFLKVMAAHIVEDHFRRENNQKGGGRLREEDSEKALETVPAPSPRSMEDRIQIHECHAYLQELASEPNFVRDYKIFCLYYCDGHTAKAISQMSGIGLDVKGVESALLRLIKWLRGRLG